jgi:DNA-binding ferritin-like protein (Dps family)
MMKQLFTFSVLLVASLLFSCNNKPNPADAAAYNDIIVEEQSKIVSQFNVFSSALEAEREDYISHLQIQLEALLKAIDNGITVVSAMEPFDGNTDFKEVTLTLFNTYKKVCQNDFKQLVHLMEKLENGEITEQEETEMDEVAGACDMNITEAETTFLDFQKEWAIKYNFSLTKR